VKNSCGTQGFSLQAEKSKFDEEKAEKWEKSNSGQIDRLTPVNMKIAILTRPELRP